MSVATNAVAGRALSRRRFGAMALATGIAMSASSRAIAQDQGPATPNPLGPAVPPEYTDFADDWPLFQGNLRADRVAANSPIDTTNVTQLERAWTFTTPNVGGFGSYTSAPLVVGDVVYIQDSVGTVFALNRETGEQIWVREYNVPSIGPGGIAIGYGMIFGVLRETAEIFALDAGTGEEIWKIVISNFSLRQSSMAPTVYDNIVYVESGAGYLGGGRARLVGLDAQTGMTLWEFDLMEENGWENPRLNSGAGLWYPLAVDDEGNLYFGVGNPAPWPGTEEYPNGSSRPGSNLYSSSMVSLDSSTGAVRWYYQAIEHDLFDLDFQNTPVLGAADVNGAETKVVIGSGKTGTVVMVDAETGEVYWEAEVGRHENDDLTEVPEGESIEVYPGSLGGVETPIAYSNGTVFVPVLNYSTTYTTDSYESSGDFSEATGEFYALNAADGSVKWQLEFPTMITGAATVANDVVFTGGLDGIFRAFHAETGDLLWSDQCSSGLNAPPAISRDMVFVPAGAPFVPTAEQDAATLPESGNELVAYRLGGGGATPEAGS
jgi:glucose dehydrogenase